MPEHLTDLLTEKEIAILKGISLYDLSEYYFDNTILIKRNPPIISDSCVSFKSENSWLSLGTRTTGPDGFTEYNSLRIFENAYPKEHPNQINDNTDFVPNAKERLGDKNIKLTELFIYTITQTYVNLTTITYDCAISINLNNNTQLFIYADPRWTFGIHVSTRPEEMIEEYDVSYLSRLTKRQII